MKSGSPTRMLLVGRLITTGPFLVAAALGCGVGWWVLRTDTSRIPALAAAPREAALGTANAPTPGEEVDIRTLAESGKTTIVDFYSMYCGPCMALKPVLERLAERRSDVRLVAVDINRPGHRGIDWNSPVAREYGLETIPHLAVFGPDRTLLAEDSATDPAARRLVDRLMSD